MSDELRPDSAEEAVVDADQLIAELREARFGRYFVLAALLVAAIVAVSSIRYFSLCSKYGTWDPRAAIKVEKEANRKKEAEAKREDRRRAAAAGKSRKAAPPDAKAADNGKSAVEKELEETTTKRPTGSDVSLDKDLDLE
ncbi:hypothetical protein HQ560_16630 [bacterium]|nr:hypothetical protein [bacterium]